jgi:hypothetical protein
MDGIGFGTVYMLFFVVCCDITGGLFEGKKVTFTLNGCCSVQYEHDSGLNTKTYEHRVKRQTSQQRCAPRKYKMEQT